MFKMTQADIGRYVRRISTGEIGKVRRDPGNGWLHPSVQYEWKAYAHDLEYVTVASIREPSSEVRDPITLFERVQDALEGRTELKEIRDPDVTSAIYDALICESVVYREYMRLRSEQAGLRARIAELTQENVLLTRQIFNKKAKD